MFHYEIPGAVQQPEVRREPGKLPEGYGENRLTLMVRDPYWAFAYWEVAGWKKKEIEKNIGKEKFQRSTLVIKIFWDSDFKSLEEMKNLLMEIDVTGPARSWYINLGKPGCKFKALLGYKTPDGEFIVVAVSNNIETPRATFSDIVDENWLHLEETYRRIQTLVGDSASSPQRLEDIRKDLARKVEAQFAPGSLFMKPERK
ncbi:MAG: DUF4912 domain-containing protein [Firmicutes bacterium]|nr:DUF4912 domain-containing protein [Bacillota bacterium]